MGTPFIVCSLPRSRSYWASCFLSHAGKPVGHDLLVYLRSFEDFSKVLREDVGGTCETAGMLSWKLIRHKLPEVRVALLRRDPREVIASLNRHNWFGMETEVWLREEMLNAMERLPGVRSFRSSELSEVSVAKDFFEFCTRESFDQEKWEQIRDVRLVIDMNERARYMLDHMQELAEFKGAVLAEASRLGGHSCLRLN